MAGVFSQSNGSARLPECKNDTTCDNVSMWKLCQLDQMCSAAQGLHDRMCIRCLLNLPSTATACLQAWLSLLSAAMTCQGCPYVAERTDRRLSRSDALARVSVCLCAHLRLSAHHE